MSNENQEFYISQLELSSKIIDMLSTEYPDLKINTRQFNAILKSSKDISDELNQSHQKAVHNSGLDQWLKSDETGLSSLYLAMVLSGRYYIAAEYAIPRDPSDFQRCRNMLNAAPELKEHLHLVSKESNEWKHIVDNWDYICQLIDQDDYRTAFNFISQ